MLNLMKGDFVNVVPLILYCYNCVQSDCYNYYVLLYGYENEM